MATIVLQLRVEDGIAIEPERAIGPFASLDEAAQWTAKRSPFGDVDHYTILQLESPES